MKSNLIDNVKGKTQEPTTQATKEINDWFKNHHDSIKEAFERGINSGLQRVKELFDKIQLIWGT